MKTAGTILLLIGIVGLILFGMEAINNSDSFKAFGLNVAVTKANWTPVLISGVVAIAGFFLVFRKKRV